MAAAAEQASYTFVVLLFNCLLTFGSYFCFDIPSVLQEQFQGNLTCPNGTHPNRTRHNSALDCVEGLGMTPAQYNLLYAIYAWTCAESYHGLLVQGKGTGTGIWTDCLFPVLGVSSTSSSPSSLRPNLECSGHSGEDKYSGYSQQAGAYVAGAVYDSSLILSAAVGILIASMWPSIPHVVPQATLGTAVGLATSVQMIGVGLSNLIVGHILGTTSSEVKIPLWHWQQMMIFMLSNTVACIVASISLNVVDKKQGGTLNRVRKGARVDQEDRDPAGAAPLLDNETRQQGSVS